MGKQYKVHFQTSGMHAPASWEAQDNWPGSTDSLDYALHAMLQFSNQFAKQWADESVVDLDVYVVDTHTGKNVASVHFEKPRWVCVQLMTGIKKAGILRACTVS